MLKSKDAFIAVRFEGFELDLHGGELRKDGTPTVRLPEQSFQILAMLLESAGKVVSRRDIQQRLWPDGTVVEFEHSIGAAMNRLRQVLGDSAENARYIETLTRRGYRWIAGVEWVAEAGCVPQAHSVSTSRSLRWVLVGGTGLAALGLALGSWYIRNVKAHRLTEKDTIVLADFTNATGEVVFDDALRQGLEVQLQQSPFLNLVSEEQIRQTLQMMKQRPDAKLTPHIAREVCQRTNGATVLELDNRDRHTVPTHFEGRELFNGGITGRCGSSGA